MPYSSLVIASLIRGSERFHDSEETGAAKILGLLNNLSGYLVLAICEICWDTRHDNQLTQTKRIHTMTACPFGYHQSMSEAVFHAGTKAQKSELTALDL